MREWWLWRTKPAPKGVAKVVETFNLPMAYQHGAYRFENSLVEVVLPAIHSDDRSDVYTHRPVGGMLTIDIYQQPRVLHRRRRNVSSRRFLLTPSLYIFVDLREFYPDFRLQHGHPLLWIQPEIFNLTGEIYQGNAVDKLLPISFQELQDFAQTNEAGGFILAALDSFMQSGQRVDARFRP
jgi:hypothetical protein